MKTGGFGLEGLLYWQCESWQFELEGEDSGVFLGGGSGSRFRAGRNSAAGSLRRCRQAGTSCGLP